MYNFIRAETGQEGPGTLGPIVSNTFLTQTFGHFQVVSVFREVWIPDRGGILKVMTHMYSSSRLWSSILP